MVYINRKIKGKLDKLLAKGRSILLLGPRQTGKTTLLNHIKSTLTLSFIQPRTRLRYEKDPSLLADEVKALDARKEKPLVIVDEVQKVPLIMDVVQDLVDNNIAQFILTGSSARKLKRGKHVNLLPGRVIPLHMDPLSVLEIPKAKLKLNDLLLFGALPEIVLSDAIIDKKELLEAYVLIYLEEEVRSEALVRNLANFSRFLELAASESGYPVNCSKLSQIVGVAHTTIADYYQILEDCLIVERVEPYLKSKTRHRLSKKNKYLFFDLGVRRVAAREGTKLPDKIMGHLFEQYVGLELIRQSRLSSQRITVRYWQDLNGIEVDWLLEMEESLLPIEIKYTDKPRKQDARHLMTFLNEYDEAKDGYIICQVPRKMKLADNIYALPWQQMNELIPAL
jgi:uncharacterized protein